MTGSAAEPAAAVARLASSTEPFLLGVRHHSPAVSVALPALLEQFDPQVLLIELPTQFQRWLEWLAHPETSAPVALAGAGGPLSFYPFADFSPELVALRWAREHGVPAVAFDLPLGDPGWQQESAEHDGPDFASALRRSATGREGDDLWDRVVEAPAPGSAPEQVRRAALAVGWALRAGEGAGVSQMDLRRESHMRSVLRAQEGLRCAAVVGAFHCAGLVEHVPDGAPATQAAGASAPQAVGAEPAEVVTSLVPYSHPLLDSRSGYPAGIRDPRWQSRVLEAAGEPAAVSSALAAVAVEVCRGVRVGGHPAGPGEAREVVRVAEDLARLRGLPAPARGELVEALTTVLTQGEPVGRGRVVARAMEQALVGERTGRLAPGTPRSGLGPAVEGLLGELRLPRPDAPARRELRLDPLRSPLDRRREVALQRLRVCGAAYAQALDVTGLGSAEALTTRWSAEWTPTCAALLEVAGLRGVTLEQASAGTLSRLRLRQQAQGGATAYDVLIGLRDAAVCGLPDLVAERLGDVADVLPATATLPELLDGLDLLALLGQGGVAGLPEPVEVAVLTEQLGAAAVRQVDGLAGSTEVDDARALLALVLRGDRAVSLRLQDALARLAANAGPLMRGAALGVRTLLGLESAAALGERVAGWLDLEVPGDLRERLRGLLAVAGPLLESGGEVLEPLVLRLEQMPDPVFLRRLPSVRGGFDVLSPAARERLLATVEARLGGRLDLALDVDAEVLAAWARADADALSVLERAGLAGAVALAPGDRWRLLLGRQRDRLPPDGRRLSAALDELYGNGRGEGSADPLAGDGGGGVEQPYPSVREWAEELTGLFGAQVREEVLAAAAAAGRVDAALAMDPRSVRPSVDLLTSVLSLAGALPEQSVERLRPLIARVVADLTRELATTLTPALAGLATARPTRRPGGPLDLRRTVAANLRTARKDAEGRVLVVPERPVFATRAKRSVDWRLVLVVDVSGSMEASTVWSAITASVLAAVPALSVHMLTFSTEVVDLSGLVQDPLALLLEVSVGGGTSIAKGVAAARGLVTVPTRTMVVVVSDFEEGGPLGPLLAEVRALVEAGVHVLGCASLDASGAPRYSVGTAQQLVAAGMPVAALSPLELARWVAEQVR